MAARRSSCSALPSASPSSLTLRFHLRRIDAARGAQRGAQPVALRVGAVLEALAAARVGLAGEQHLVEALRLPQAVGGHDHAQHRLRLELERFVHRAVVPRDEQREIAEPVRHGQPRAQPFEQLLGALLVAMVPRQ